jgi:large subunit ribosomal protein L35
VRHQGKVKQGWYAVGKFKPHRGTKKRVKVSATGKLSRRKAFQSHLLTKKSSSRKRKFRKELPVSGADAGRMRHLLGR